MFYYLAWIDDCLWQSNWIVWFELRFMVVGKCYVWCLVVVIWWGLVYLVFCIVRLTWFVGLLLVVLGRLLFYCGCFGFGELIKLVFLVVGFIVVLTLLGFVLLLFVVWLMLLCIVWCWGFGWIVLVSGEFVSVWGCCLLLFVFAWVFGFFSFCIGLMCLWWVCWIA